MTASTPEVDDAVEGVHRDDAREAESHPTPRHLLKRTWVLFALVGAVYALLSTAANVHAWVDGIGHTIQIPGGSDDAEEVWFLALTPWSIVHGHNPLAATDWLNAPVGMNTMDNTTMPLFGLLFTPVTVLFGAVATFNVVLDAAICASAVAFFAMARLFVRWPVAFAGGLLYGFSPYAVAVGKAHLFLLFQAAPPLIIFFVTRFLRSRSMSPWLAGFWVGACYVMQFFVSTEVFATLVAMTICSAVLGAAYVVFRRVAVDWRRLGAMSGCAAVMVVVGTGYAGWLALEGPEHVVGPVQVQSVIAGMSTDPAGLVIPTANQHFTLGEAALGDTYVAVRTPQWQLESESVIENGSYVGVPLAVLLLTGTLVLRRRRLVLFGAAMAAIALLLSMGTDLHVDGHRTGIPLPNEVFANLPLFESAVSARWITYFWLFAALLLVLIVDAAHTRMTSHDEGGTRLRAMVVSTALVCVALFPLLPAWPYQPVTQVNVPAWFSTGAQSLPVGSTAVVYPPANPNVTSAMVWQALADMRFKMVGGYAIFTAPTGTASFAPQATLLEAALAQCYNGGPPPLEPAAVREELRTAGASEAVVVQATPGASCARELFDRALGGALGTGGVWLWRF
jgi:hypothetical protein